MGTGASVVGEDRDINPLPISLKKLPEAIEEAIYIHEKFPLVIDPSGLGEIFLKYQMGSFIPINDATLSKMKLNRSLVAALQHGRTLTLSFESLDYPNIEEKIFEENIFPKEIISRSLFYSEDVWRSTIKPSLGDPNPDEISISQEFVFIILTRSNFIPLSLSQNMFIIKLQNDEKNDLKKEKGDGMMEELTEIYGRNEVVRNSERLIDAGFDGDLEELKNLLDKGYHIDSLDSRKHTALSEASCQGHSNMVTYLLSMGADPNALNDTNRSPIWRAAFNGHISVVEILLKSGGDPDYRDTVSMESAYDVSPTEELRNLLGTWDRSITSRLVRERVESKIKTAAEREHYEKAKLRQDLLDRTQQGDLEGVKEILFSAAAEAQRSASKPRITAECRNDYGQSLLSIACQKDWHELVRFLLTYWMELDCDPLLKTLPDQGQGQSQGQRSAEASVFKTNPNSRDLKGWSCCCVAVMHDSARSLQQLLAHGADPAVRSSYNKNAWDLAQDELDAALHVVRSKELVRKVLEDYDCGSIKGSKIFGCGKQAVDSIDLYDGLGSNGSPIVMQQEMAIEAHTGNNDSAVKVKKKKKLETNKNQTKSSTSKSNSSTKKH